MRRLALMLAFTGAMIGGGLPDSWLPRVRLVMTASERDLYLSLSNEREREQYRASFWNDKSVTADEYFDRLSYADAKFGSGKEGSGLNTDQGRVYIALGPPTQVSQLPSSRVLQPLEIWRYDHVPGIPVSSEIQLVFFRPRGVGFPKLYSPQIHSMRSLLINNAGTRGAFPANDVVSSDDLMNRISLSPAELEAVDAATSVARGVRGSGNSELLYRLSSPIAMLRQKREETVHSRIYTARERPRITLSDQQRTAEMVPVIDLTVEGMIQNTIGIEIQGVEAHEAKFAFEAPTSVAYHHRLYFLPGTWTVLVNVDGQRTAMPIEVHRLSASDPEAAAVLASLPLTSGMIDIQYRVNLNRESQWVSLGRQYARSADVAHATVCFRKALAVNPASTPALAGMGRLLAMQNQLDEAREYLLKALQLQPRDFESLVALASVTARFQDTEQAIGYYQQADAIRPSGEVQMAIRQLRTQVRTAAR